jgi:hypothetical protein
MFCSLWVLANDGQNRYCIKGSKEYEKIRIQHSKNHNWGPKKGHIVSEITRDKIRKSLTGKMKGALNPMYGKNYFANKTTEEIKIINDKRSLALKGNNNNDKKKIYKGLKIKCVELDKIYPDVYAITKDLGLVARDIIRSCTLHKIHKSYHFEFV